MNNNSDDPKEELKYNYEEIHDKPLDEIVDDKVVEEEPKEPPKEPEKEPEKTEPPKEPERIDANIDPEKLAEDIASKLAEKNEPLVEEKTDQEEYQDWADKFKEESGKEPTWTDVASYLKEEAVQELERRQEAKQKAEAEDRQAKAEAEKVRVEEFNKIVDEDLDDLYKAEKLTPIKDKDNPSDQGLLERKALFQAMLETNQKRVAENKRPIYSIKEIYYEHYTKPSAQPAGEDAPISLGKGTTSSDNEQEIDYAKDVHNKPWSWFTRNK